MTVKAEMTKPKQELEATSLSEFEKLRGFEIISPDYGLIRAECPDGSTHDEDYGMVMTCGEFYYLVLKAPTGWVAHGLPEGSKTFWRMSRKDKEVELK